jgi:ribosomal protein L14E/L6E/L27E
VKTAWSQGKGLRELAKEKGITDEQLKTKLEEARAKALAANMQVLVDKGVITRAQADARIAVMKQKVTERSAHKGGKPMMKRFLQR